ncbi:MAG: DUF599 domain-containing protein [Zoogloeaceae bacterium]|jgi:uncharacterized membrane protein|nr:DUF599 domain-containing protein [Zoogloeaceae bacterium]
MNLPLWLQDLAPDALAAMVSVLIVIAYYAFLRSKTRHDPTYTIHGVNQLARREWIAGVIADPRKDIMAVQTLRNFIMGASLMASTATFLIIGTLTLSGQTENIGHSWHVLSTSGILATELWIVKVICLLIDFIVAFFAFAMAVRLTNHVVFMINLPDYGHHHALSTANIARRLNRAGDFFAIGMRAFFFAVPLVFWLFGPALLVIATIGLVIALYHVDRSDPAE